MNIIFESESAIRFDFTELFAARSITSSDVLEAVFMIKSNAADDDNAALVSLDLNSGLSWDSDILLAKITDWTNLKKGVSYEFGVGFKVVGSVRYIEPALSDDKLTVIQDFIRG